MAIDSSPSIPIIIGAIAPPTIDIIKIEEAFLV